jgi:hypothetical protein
MKRNLLVAAAMAVVLVAANLSAHEPTTSKTVTPDWHYRWHEGRWWYWLPENSKWLVWTGSTWVPFEQFSSCPCVYSASQAKSSNGNAEAENRTESASSGGSNYYRSAPSGYSGGSGSNYSGYGWSWGPGTAYRDSPGRRF